MPWSIWKEFEHSWVHQLYIYIYRRSTLHRRLCYDSECRFLIEPLEVAWLTPENHGKKQPVQNAYSELKLFEQILMRHVLWEVEDALENAKVMICFGPSSRFTSVVVLFWSFHPASIACINLPRNGRSQVYRPTAVHIGRKGMVKVYRWDSSGMLLGCWFHFLHRNSTWIVK